MLELDVDEYDTQRILTLTEHHLTLFVSSIYSFCNFSEEERENVHALWIRASPSVKETVELYYKGNDVPPHSLLSGLLEYGKGHSAPRSSTHSNC